MKFLAVVTPQMSIGEYTLYPITDHVLPVFSL